VQRKYIYGFFYASLNFLVIFNRLVPQFVVFHELIFDCEMFLINF
jgi:hypothetical protein